jgi:hypothetical protein
VKWTFALLLVACATAIPNPYAHNELVECPAQMTREQAESGIVRCRAECASWNRDMMQYTYDCKCVCKPAVGASPYRSNQL